MSTGLDVAKFVTQMTGQDYEGLYNQSKEYEEQMAEQKQKHMDGFKALMERMDKAEENKKPAIFD
jgi:hypothetical protein